MTQGAPVTRLLLILCIGVHLLLWLLGEAQQEWAVLAAGLIPGRLAGAVLGLPGSVPAWLTLLTHQFLHGGWAHLVMNMVFLAAIGRMVEVPLGSARFALIYFVGGVVGGLAQVIAAPSSSMPVVGASGAIAAIFAAYALLYSRTPEEPTRVMGFTLTSEAVRAIRLAALWTGIQLLTAVAFNDGTSGMGIGRIAIWSHVGGFVAGLLMARPLMRDFERPE